MLWNFSIGYSKVWYFAAENSHYYTFFPKLKRGLAKIVNLGFPACLYLNFTKRNTFHSRFATKTSTDIIFSL